MLSKCRYIRDIVRHVSIAAESFIVRKLGDMGQESSYFTGQKHDILWSMSLTYKN